MLYLFNPLLCFATSFMQLITNNNNNYNKNGDVNLNRVISLCALAARQHGSSFACRSTVFASLMSNVEEFDSYYSFLLSNHTNDTDVCASEKLESDLAVTVGIGLAVAAFLAYLPQVC